MSHPCPWCREPLNRSERNWQTCPHCHRPLHDDRGELRTIDLRYSEVKGELWTTYQRLVVYGSITSAVLFLLLPLAHMSMSPVVVVPLVVLAHMLALRLLLTRRAWPLLSPVRRGFIRWIVRLSMLWLGSFGYGLTTLPLVGAIAGVATFVGITTGAHRYVLWSLDREYRRQPLVIWEKLVLFGLAALTLCLFVALVAGALVIGWSVSQLLEMAQ